MISVIIPNWNGKHFLSTCLKALEGQSFRDFEVILVDNASCDGSSELVVRDFPWVKILQLPNNLGFAGGVNMGIKEAQGNLIALLNNDTEVTPNWLEYLYKATQKYPSAGAIASKVLRFYKRNIIDSAGDVYRTDGTSAHRGGGEEDKGQFDREAFVFGASGVSAMYRKEMLDEIGLFEDYFFAYYEDVDLCFRAQIAGWKVIYIPEAVVYHIGSGSTSSLSSLSVYHTTKNELAVICRNMPLGILIKNLPNILLARILKIFFYIYYGRSKEYFKGLAWFILNLPKLLSERKKIQKTRKVSINYLNSIITHRSLKEYLLKIKKILFP